MCSTNSVLPNEGIHCTHTCTLRHSGMHIAHSTPDVPWNGSVLTTPALRFLSTDQIEENLVSDIQLKRFRQIKAPKKTYECSSF